VGACSSISVATPSAVKSLGVARQSIADRNLTPTAWRYPICSVFPSHFTVPFFSFIR
jgi:hypothetical protein